MRRAVILLITISLLAMACNAAELAPTPTFDDGAAQTRVAQDVAATVAALSTPTSIPFHTPTLPPPSPTSTSIPLTFTPPPPTLAPITALSPPLPIPDTYVIEEERLIGDYAVRLWRNTAEDSWGYDNIVTISMDGQTLAQVELVAALDDLTGTDVTGEGHPDVIVETFTGGAHCCFSTIVYDLGPALTEVLHTPESNCGGRFDDLDEDAVFEFTTCDDLFAYQYCAYAISPMVQVILQYEPGRGYVPASPRFAHLYAGTIAMHTEMAENATPEEWAGWDETPKCGVLPLILDYLYTGQEDRAWSEFNRLYNYPDAMLFWAEIVQGVGQSSLYVAAGPLPEAPLPPYYMLQLLTNCGPDWHYIGFLGDGQAPCDPDVPRRDVYWLDTELRAIDLLTQDERLKVAPEGCTDDCRLDVLRYEDSSRVASIRLDTTVGFPGAVYRVDDSGLESVHWRLRGDLTWEQSSP